VGTSTNSAIDLGVSNDLGVSPNLGISVRTGGLTSRSGLTALDATADIATSVPAIGTTKVTLDSPALGVTSDVVAAKAVDSTSTITVGAPAVTAIMDDVTTPKLSLTADTDASTSTAINALLSSATATTNTGISAVLGTDIANTSADIAGQSTNAFDLSATVGVENVLPHQLPVVADTAVSAVPEADTYAMLLAGLGLMGFVVNRRKGKAEIEI
jgi:hypothetical protein